MTPEERKAITLTSLAKGRETARANRAAKAAAPAEEAPAVMPALPFDDDLPAAVVEEPPAPGEQTPFEAFLSILDAETRELVPEAELQAIFEAQQIKARAAKREKLKKTATEKALHAANVAAGLLPETATAHAEWRRWMDRKVSWVIDLPELGDIGIRCDGQIYRHGTRVEGTMAQYLSFRDTEWKNKRAELDFEGRSRMHHLRQQGIGALNMRLN